MKLGIISDVHGDYEALTTVLNRLETIHQVDDILCAGDLVGRGPEEDRVVDLFRRRDIPTVRGNHDEWGYDLSADNAAYLRQLPLEWRQDFANATIFMCHGKPGNNMWGLYRDHVSATLINMMLESLGADVIVTGHTHVPMFMRVDLGCVVNPGSIFTFKNPRASSHTYGVLCLPEMTFDLYDVLKQPEEAVRMVGD